MALGTCSLKCGLLVVSDAGLLLLVYALLALGSSSRAVLDLLRLHKLLVFLRLTEVRALLVDIFKN